MNPAINREISIDAIQTDINASEGKQSDTTERLPSQPKLPSLTGSRFWAALLVFLFHSSLPSDLAPFSDPTIQHIYTVIVGKAGWLGVSYFFILSGFIMVWSARDDDTVGYFYLRRFAKIYPTHCLTWVMAFLIGAMSIYQYKLWASNLLLLNTWVDDVHYFFVGNRPSWSLCIEAMFYLSFPFLFRMMQTIPKKFDLLGLTAVIAASLLLQTYIYIWVEPNKMMGAFPISQQHFWVSYIFPPSRIFEFLAGMFAARLLMNGRALVLTKTASFTLLAATYIGSMYLPYQFSMSVVFIIPVCLLIISVAGDDLKKPQYTVKYKNVCMVRRDILLILYGSFFSALLFPESHCRKKV